MIITYDKHLKNPSVSLSFIFGKGKLYKCFFTNMYSSLVSQNCKMAKPYENFSVLVFETVWLAERNIVSSSFS